MSLPAPAPLSQRQNQTDDVGVLRPLDQCGISESAPAETSHGYIATDPDPGIILGLDGLETIPFYVIIVEVPDDWVFIEYRGREMEDPAG